MKFCTECGAQLEDKVRVCPYCNKVLSKYDTGYKENGQMVFDNDYAQEPATQRGKVPVKLSEGEVLIRKYHLTKQFIFNRKGMLYVTNKRLLFATERPLSKMVLSTPIETVGSVDLFRGWMIDKVLFILAWAFLIFGIVYKEVNSFSYIFGNSGSGGDGSLAFGIIAFVLLLILSIRKSVFLRVAAVNSGEGLVLGKGMTMGGAFTASYGFAGPDADRAMNELGALVLDLQQIGDAAVNKWKR